MKLGTFGISISLKTPDSRKLVLHETIEAALERGQKIDTLIDKSNDLSGSSKMFYKTAKKQNQCCRWAPQPRGAPAPAPTIFLRRTPLAPDALHLSLSLSFLIACAPASCKIGRRCVDAGSAVPT